jgi:hypothetical protein
VRTQRRTRGPLSGREPVQPAFRWARTYLRLLRRKYGRGRGCVGSATALGTQRGLIPLESTRVRARRRGLGGVAGTGNRVWELECGENSLGHHLGFRRAAPVAGACGLGDTTRARACSRTDGLHAAQRMEVRRSSAGRTTLCSSGRRSAALRPPRAVLHETPAVVRAWMLPPGALVLQQQARRRGGSPGAADALPRPDGGRCSYSWRPAAARSSPSPRRRRRRCRAPQLTPRGAPARPRCGSRSASPAGAAAAKTGSASGAGWSATS